MVAVRIAVGGFLHESHSFAPRPTTYADFLQPGGLPPFYAGADLIDAMRPRSVPLAGAIAVAEEAGVDLVPLAWGFANPAARSRTRRSSVSPPGSAPPCPWHWTRPPSTASTSTCTARR